MKRFVRLAMCAAIVAAFAGVGTASAHHSCRDGVSFTYCSEHLPFDRIPLSVRLNHAGRPSGVTETGVAAATRAAMDEWNRAWPKVMANKEGITGGIGSCMPLCLSGTTASVAGYADGVSVIGWGDPAFCDGSHAERIAVACLWYEGESGNARHRIKEVDIIINVAKTWRVANDVVVGELQNTLPFLGSATWFDIQSVLTHELGHALGLEDIGNTNRPWPADLTDAVRHDQTMYRWYVAGTVNKRSLGAGDIAGLQLAAWDTANDT